MNLQDKLEHKLQIFYAQTQKEQDPSFIVCHPETKWELIKICGMQLGWLSFQQINSKYRNIPFAESTEVAKGEFKLTIEV